MNKPYINTNFDIYSFQNGLSHSFNSTGFYFKSKIVVSHEMKNVVF